MLAATAVAFVISGEAQLQKSPLGRRRLQGLSHPTRRSSSAPRRSSRCQPRNANGDPAVILLLSRSFRRRHNDEQLGAPSSSSPPQGRSVAHLAGSRVPRRATTCVAVQPARCRLRSCARGIAHVPAAPKAERDLARAASELSRGAGLQSPSCGPGSVALVLAVFAATAVAFVIVEGAKAESTGRSSVCQLLWLHASLAPSSRCAYGAWSRDASTYGLRLVAIAAPPADTTAPIP